MPAQRCFWFMGVAEVDAALCRRRPRPRPAFRPAPAKRRQARGRDLARQFAFIWIDSPIRKTRPAPKPRSIGHAPLTRRERVELTVIREEIGYPRRPKTRGECVDGPRPCPWVSCRAHLALEVNPENGSVKINFPHIFDRGGTPDLSLMPATCALDVADANPRGVTLEEVGIYTNTVMERGRQLVEEALLEVRQKLNGGGEEG